MLGYFLRTAVEERRSDTWRNEWWFVDKGQSLETGRRNLSVFYGLGHCTFIKHDVSAAFFFHFFCNFFIFNQLLNFNA